MITELTPAQQAELKVWHDRWYKIGVSTDRIDINKTTKLFPEIYKLCGYEPPQHIVICASPCEALKKINEQQAKDGEQKLDEKKYYDTFLWGSFDSYWVAFYLFCNKVLEVKYDNVVQSKLEVIAQIAQNSFWWWPFDTHCFVSEKPTILNLNERKQLHSTTEAAMQFADGWAIYAVNGIRVPGKIIKHPELITIDEIEEEKNAEIRRLMIDQFNGEDIGRYVRESGAQMISTHVLNDQTYKLYRKDVPNDESIVMLHCYNSTRVWTGEFKQCFDLDEDGGEYSYDCPVGPGEWKDKEYWTRVPPEFTDSAEALAWTLEETKETYKPDVET